MAEWNHRICGDCWLAKPENFGWEANGECHFRPPLMLPNPEPGTCCFCGNKTVLGIFVRHDPKELKCSHPDD